MKKSFLRSLALVPMLFLLTACPNPPPAEESCNFVQNAFSRRVSWARTPVKFYIDKASFASLGPEDYYKAVVSVQEAMDVWNKAVGRTVLELVGPTTALKAPKVNSLGRVVPDAYNGIYRVEKSVFENSSAKDEQARTSISYRGDFIYEADILIDGSERFYFEDEARVASEGKVQFKSLMIHELGHVLGLGHIDDPNAGSVMYPRLQFGQMRPTPELVKNATGEETPAVILPEVDEESLSCEY